MADKETPSVMVLPGLGDGEIFSAQVRTRPTATALVITANAAGFRALAAVFEMFAEYAEAEYDEERSLEIDENNYFNDLSSGSLLLYHSPGGRLTKEWMSEVWLRPLERSMVEALYDGDLIVEELRDRVSPHISGKINDDREFFEVLRFPMVEGLVRVDRVHGLEPLSGTAVLTDLGRALLDAYSAP